MIRIRPTTSIRTSQDAMHARRPARRGIAMMLVLVALLVTTVLVGAALTSRDNAPAIGLNASSAAEATWSAESAVNFAVGAITQAEDLTTLLGGDDTLSSAMTFNGAAVNIKVANLNGDPPADTDRELIITATATISGVDKVVEKHISLVAGGEAPDAADPYLDEFAVFTTERCNIDNATKIGIWDLSPEARSSLALAKIGVGFTNVSDATIDAGAAFSRAALYCDTDASLALESYLAGCPQAFTSMQIPFDVPTLPSSLPLAFASLPNVGTDVAPAPSTTVSVAAPGKYNNIDARNNSTVVLDASVSPNFQFQNIQVDTGATLRIRGTVAIYVAQDVSFDSADLVLEDASASATVYVAGDMSIDNQSKLGIDPADTLTADGIVSQYVSPSRLRFLALSVAQTGSPDPQWIIENGSVTVGVIHDPLGVVRYRTGAMLYGHVVAREFRLESGSALAYCPTLDSHIGYSTPTGPFYDASANAIPELVTILDDVASTTSHAEGFANKFNLEYATAKSDGTLDLVDLTSSTTKTITETLNIGGLAIY